MNQDSTKPGPEGMKGSWRDRLGINKELPKIAEEFKEPSPRAEPSEGREPHEKPASPVRAGTPLTKPAPMAPRPNAAEFGERLRQQREAAERMAEQRVAEAKERAMNEQRSQPPQAPQPRGAAPPPQPSPAKPRFSFADEEVRKARQEPPAPREQSSRQWTQAPASPSPRPVFTADRQSAPPDPRRTPPPLQRQSSAPQARAAPPAPPRVPPSSHPERPAARPGRPAAPLNLERSRRAAPADPARQIDEAPHDDPYRRAQRNSEMPRSGGDFRGAHSREFDYVEEESDDLFEDEQSFSPQPRRRATPQDYSQAYREFDGETQERRRTGPILLIAALVAVGAIAGGLIYFYQSSAGTQATSAENVPVVDEPSAPVKTEPQPAETAEDSAPPAQEQSMAPATEMQAGAQKKQIYDRILGETTLEEQEQVVPSEEQPVPPQGEQSQGFDADPLPLPMPPAPGGGTDDQGSLDSPGAQTTAAAKSASETASQQASPASATLETEPAEQSEAALATPAPSPVPAAANEPEPPLPQPEPVQASEEQPAPLQQSEEQPPAAISQQKAPSAEKKIESELAFAEQQGAAATQASEGPIQIAQLPGFDASASTGTTTFAPLPQALPDLTEGSSSEGGSTARRARPIGFRESDKVVANVNRNFNRAKQVQVAQIEADPITTQSVTAAPSAPQAAAPAPQPAPSQQQAALEPAPKPQITHGTGSGFTIQLASYKSEGDAVAGYEQLRQQHGQLIGSLTPNIQKADLGTNGTFYRLHLGSFSSKEAAKKTCTSLLAAGERDCIVKSR